MLKTHGSNVELLKTIKNSFRTLKKSHLAAMKLGNIFMDVKT